MLFHCFHSIRFRVISLHSIPSHFILSISVDLISFHSVPSYFILCIPLDSALVHVHLFLFGSICFVLFELVPFPSPPFRIMSFHYISSHFISLRPFNSTPFYCNSCQFLLSDPSSFSFSRIHSSRLHSISAKGYRRLFNQVRLSCWPLFAGFHYSDVMHCSVLNL
jgi:hypothetical protein